MHNIQFTSNASDLSEADFIIVAVPTPIDENLSPDLTILKSASNIVGENMKKGATVIYESTVYPGATEEVCVPILENTSNYIYGEEFFVGYSPERINPGDKERRFENIVKVVSGQNEATLDNIAELYSSVVKAGIHKAESIKVAEAAKVIENTQRDLNIALMNELALIFDELNINTRNVLKASSTKWNFLNFEPGLVGGHCIGVDPYYLTHKASQVGYHPEVILSGRKINNEMGKIIAVKLIKEMIRNKIEMKNAKVTILGLTFKENCPDLRNTKVIDIINELKDFGISIDVVDPYADKNEALLLYDIQLKNINVLQKSDAVIFAVKHSEFEMNKKKYLDIVNEKGIVIDLKGTVKEEEVLKTQNFWAL